MGIYTALVHKPLVKVLAERRSKTEGAIEKARADIAAGRSANCGIRTAPARSSHGGVQASGSASSAGVAGAGRSRGRGAEQSAGPGRTGARGHREGQSGGASGSGGGKRKAGRRNYSHCFAAGDDTSSGGWADDETSANSAKFMVRRTRTDVPVALCLCRIPDLDFRADRTGNRSGVPLGRPLSTARTNPRTRTIR